MPNELPALAEVHLADVIRRETLCYEGRTDLTAAITRTGNVEIYRFGGQKAFSIEADDLSGQPRCLSWARKGELLLVGTESGVVDLLYTRTGKVNPGRERHSGRDGDIAVTGISTHVSILGKSESKTNIEYRSNGSADSGTAQTIEEWFEDMNLSGVDSKPTGPSKTALTLLPHALAKVNPGDVLPRLSAIPPPSKAGPGMPAPVLRSAQKDLHLLLNYRTSHNSEGIEVTFISQQDGDVDSSIGELFNHTFKCKSSHLEWTELRQCTDSQSGLHGILRASLNGGQSDDDEKIIEGLALNLFDIPLASTGSVHTATILSNATQLKLLELYIAQTVETAVLDWNTLTSLPARFMANINETLEEKHEGHLDQQFYQLLLTGHCSDAVTEWLKEELAERGHKRWDHALTTFYHALIQLFEVSLLPALEKFALAASTLRGLATYYEGSKKFDVSPSLFTKIIEAIGSMHLLAHEALQIATREERQFRAFSSWLRHQIEIAAAEPGSTAAVELAEKEAMSTDVPKILTYLEGAFSKSLLERMVGRRLAPAETVTRLAKLELKSATTAAAIVASRDDSERSDDVLYLPIHLAHLQKQVEACSGQMRRWQSTTWSPPQEIPIELQAGLSVVDVDMKASQEGGSPLSVTTIAGIVAAVPSTIAVHTVNVKRELRSSFHKPAAQASWMLELLGVESLLDVKLLADQSLVALARDDKESRLLHIPGSIVIAGEDRILTVDDTEAYTVHVFPGGSFQPAHIYVSDNPRRRNVLVLDRNCQHWKIYRLPTDVDGIVGEQDDDNDNDGESSHGGRGEGMAID